MKETNALLSLVGDGSLREEIEQKVKDLGISDNVKFMGICNNTNELFQLWMFSCYHPCLKAYGSGHRDARPVD